MPNTDPVFSTPCSIRGLVIPADGRRLLTGSTDGFRVWDTTAVFGQPFAPAAALPSAGEPETGPPRELATLKPHSGKVPPPANVPPPAPAPVPKPPAVVTLQAQRTVSLAERGRYAQFLTFTPDGVELLTGTDDGWVRRWRVATGEEVPGGFAAHPKPICSGSLSVDGSVLATGAQAGDQKAAVWDLKSGKLLATFPEKEGWSDVRVALSTDGQVLAAYTTGRTGCWEAATGKLLGRFPPDVRGGIAFLPDSKVLACAGLSGVRLWDVTEGKQVDKLTGRTSVLLAMAVSADGKSLAGAGMNQLISIWDLPTQTERLTLRGSLESFSGLAFSPDGSRLVSYTGGERNDRLPSEVKLWDATTGKLLANLEGHQGSVGAIAFSPDGKTVVASCRDQTIRFWDVSGLSAGKETPPKP